MWSQFSIFAWMPTINNRQGSPPSTTSSSSSPTWLMTAAAAAFALVAMTVTINNHQRTSISEEGNQTEQEEAVSAAPSFEARRRSSRQGEGLQDADRVMEDDTAKGEMQRRSLVARGAGDGFLASGSFIQAEEAIGESMEVVLLSPKKSLPPEGNISRDAPVLMIHSGSLEATEESKDQTIPFGGSSEHGEDTIAGSLAVLSAKLAELANGKRPPPTSLQRSSTPTSSATTVTRSLGASFEDDNRTDVSTTRYTNLTLLPTREVPSSRTLSGAEEASRDDASNNAVDAEHQFDVFQREATKAVQRLKEMNIRLVAIDFDMTLVDVHTSGAWTDSAERLARNHFRTVFGHLIRICNSNNITVVIATFSSQIDLIRDVLRCVLLDGLPTSIPEIYGTLPGDEQHLDWNGKEEHIKRAVADLEKELKRQGARRSRIGMRRTKSITKDKESWRIQPNQVLLIDDDRENVRAALDSGHYARRFFNDANSEQVHILEDLQSLKPKVDNV